MQRTLCAAIALLLACAAAPAAAQTSGAPQAAYLTDEMGTAAGTEVRLLSAAQPSGSDAASIQFAPAAGGTTSASWAFESPAATDWTFEGDTDVVLYWDTGIDADSTVTVNLTAVSSDGVRVLGEASQSAAAG